MKILKKFNFVLLVTALLLFSSAQTAYADPLAAVSPLNHPVNHFPLWYQDGIGMTVNQCLDAAFCTFAPVDDPTNAFSVATGFGPEAFYWSAGSTFGGAGANGVLVLALEMAYGSAPPAVPVAGTPLNGTQVTFTRIQVGPLSGLVPGANYTVTHPYGVIPNLIANAAGVIPRVRFELGGVVPLDFASALGLAGANNGISPLLRWDTGFPVVDAATGNKYLGNPFIEHTVTGSPFGTNFFRIVGPNAGGAGVNTKETNLFGVEGKLADTTPPVITGAPNAPAASPARIEAIFGSSIITANVTDPLDPVNNVGAVAQVTVNLGAIGGSPNARMTLVSGTALSGMWQLTINSTVAGNFTLPVNAMDGSGNLAVPSSVNLSVIHRPVLNASVNKVIVGIPTDVILNVTQGGLPVSGATVTLSGAAAGSGATDAAGLVTINVNATASGAITATATKADFITSPSIAIASQIRPAITGTNASPPRIEAIFGNSLLSATVTDDIGVAQVTANLSSIGIMSAKANLNGSQEVPATNSTATGSGTFVIDTNANTLSFNIVFSGMQETAAHIHGPAAPGVAAGILFPLPSGSPKAGVWNYNQSQEADILAGLTYVNIHSNIFPGGEIRGQVLTTPNTQMTLTSGTATSGTWTRAVNTTIAGSFVFNVNAMDGDGNAALPSSISLEVIHRPVLTANPTKVTVGTPASITFTVTQGGIPVSGANVTLSGNATGSGITDAGGNAVISVNATSIGIITATATKDFITNPTFTIAASIPQISSTKALPPIIEATFGNSTLSAVVTDDVSVAKVTVDLNAMGIRSAKTNLNGSQEVPASTSTATGIGEILIDTNANTLRFNITFTGLEGTETGSHIHGPAAPGVAAGVLFTLPLGSPKVGVWNYPEANEADILAGLTYVNVHSTFFLGGEIRGQILMRPETPMTLVSGTPANGTWQIKVSPTIAGDFILPVNAVDGDGNAAVPSSVSLKVIHRPNITASLGRVSLGAPTNITFTVTQGGLPVSGSTVTLSGAATGSGNTDASGNAIILVTATSAGTITATASHLELFLTNAVTTVAAGAPTVASNRTNVSIATSPIPATPVMFTVMLGPGTPASGVTLTLSGAASGSGTTGADGTVVIMVNAGNNGTITATAAQSGTTLNTTTLTAKGDVNGDGLVNVVDALFIAQFTVNTRAITPANQVFADVNGDGAVTIVDALFIAQATVDLPDRPVPKTGN